MVGDFLIHYLNLVGAYIVCATLLAVVALYLSTAFSFSAIQLWAPTRFAFITGLVGTAIRIGRKIEARSVSRKTWSSAASRSPWSRRS